MLCLPKEQLFHFQRLKRYQQTLLLLEIFLYQGSIVYRHKGAYEHAKSKQKGRATFASKKATLLLVLLLLLQRLMVVEAAEVALVLVCKRPYLALLAFCRRKMGTLLLYCWQQCGAIVVVATAGESKSSN